MFDDKYTNIVIEGLRASLTGRLTHGIAHNLNGQIQAISMQIEILKRDIALDRKAVDKAIADGGHDPAAGLLKRLAGSLAKRSDQVLMLEGVLFRLEHLVDLIAKRDIEAEPGPINIESVVKEEIEFLKADLFFKHKVEVEFDTPDYPISIIMDERLLKDLLDILINLCIGQLRDAGERKIGIGIEKDGHSVKLWFSHTGKPFSREISGLEGVSCWCGAELNHFIFPVFDFAKIIAEKLKAAIEVSPQMIRLVFTVK